MVFLQDIYRTNMDCETAVTVGKFDGIHKGHTLLTNHILDKKKEGLASCLVTFKNSPRISLKKDMTAYLITNTERKYMLDDAGLDYFVECEFDDRMMETSAEDFISLLVNNLNMKYMVVGSDFRFGHKGKGDAHLLAELSKRFGFQLEVIEKIKQDSRDISSTYIREELISGNIELVNEMLGYKYFVWGEVVHGAHLGHKIGIPTINIIPQKDKLVPKYGVYISNIDIEGRKYHGITNVGMKPTVSDESILGIETHILDYYGDLYGRNLKVTFIEFLRPEMKFDSVEDLKNQMNKDKLAAYKFFNS